MNTVTQRIHKDNVEEVVLKKEIVYLDWDDVVREGETYQFYIPKRAEFVITEKTPICFLNGLQPEKIRIPSAICTMMIHCLFPSTW